VSTLTDDTTPEGPEESGADVDPPVMDEDALFAEQSEGDGDGDGEDLSEDVIVESPYDRPGQWFVVHTYAATRTRSRTT